MLSTLKVYQLANKHILGLYLWDRNTELEKVREERHSYGLLLLFISVKEMKPAHQQLQGQEPSWEIGQKCDSCQGIILGSRTGSGFHSSRANLENLCLS